MNLEWACLKQDRGDRCILQLFGTAVWHRPRVNYYGYSLVWLAIGLSFLSGDAIGQTTAPRQNSSAQAPAKQALRPIEAGVRAATTESSINQRLNENTVTVISGGLDSTYLAFASDMAIVLDSGDALRVLPMIGKGGVQNVEDVLHLRGIDLGITQTDVLKAMKRIGKASAIIEEKIVYVTKLYDEEMHVLVRSEVRDYKDLNDKVVNFGQAGSSADLSARLIFKALGVSVQSINLPQSDALAMLKSGTIAASVEISGKPVSLFSSVKSSDGIKLLSVPYVEALEADYVPAELSSVDYSGLIPEGQTVETVSVGAVLVAINWPKNTERYRRVALLVNLLFAKFAEFQKAPRHPKWKDVNLAAVLPGWKRFPAAQEWIDGPSIGAVRPEPGAVAGLPTAATTQVLPAAPAPATAPPIQNEARPNTDELFRQFQEWAKTHKQ